MPHYQLPIPRSPHPTQYPDLCYTRTTESIARMNTFLGILTLGFIILIHEWGHYIAARICKVGVDVFSIVFGPRLFGIKRGDTDWRLSAVPLGGYVRMAGQDITDIDSTSDS